MLDMVAIAFLNAGEKLIAVSLYSGGALMRWYLACAGEWRRGRHGIVENYRL